MRFGSSRLGVIAVVSLLVTAAAPERDDSSGTERESGIDHSSTVRASRISSEVHSWPIRVTAETGSGSPSSFVKIEFERVASWSTEASRSPSPPRLPLVPRIRHTAGSTETPTTVRPPRFSSSPTQAINARNFAHVTVPADVRSANSATSFVATFADKRIRQSESDDSRLVYSSPREFDEKSVVALDSPLSTAITESSIRLLPRYPSLDEGETIRKSGRTESPNNYEDKRSSGSSNEKSGNRRARSSGAKSAGTMNSQLTTTTTTRRRLLDENFRKPTERYEVETIRGTRESSKNKANNGELHFGNGEPEGNEIRRTTERIISVDSEDGLHSESRYHPNYSTNPGTTVRFPIQARVDRTVDDSAHKLRDESLRKVDNALREESLVREQVKLDHRELTVESMNESGSLNRETVVYSGVTEEISHLERTSSESSLDLSMKARPYSSLSGNLTITSFTVGPISYEAASLDNHKAFEVQTFQGTRTAEQQQQHEKQHNHQRAASLESPPLPTRLHDAISDDVRTERRPAVIPANQIAAPKSAFPAAKNHSKPSINLIDGKANKIFYEIKPSLITEMDRSDKVEVTTTPRRIFDKFLIPSVPSAFGKFGPYFLDEEDRRNVTERIGSTVQLDCRIGLLGHRKVTWLQHYKDSFRLLTVERESYSVDRRISLNFQYPNNWRLQIAYASLRDSGLYKCQVEIDQDRSLVKRYNVIITAPVLTITDDSGRSISGERHLKAGSALKLRCEARDVMQRLNESVLWMRGDETLTEDVSENKTTEVVNEKEIMVVVSTLLVERATPRHAGNYSCVVPDKARNTIAVHVLNGELPAAVQHGSGVSTAVLNLWLIHLTASYGFFR